MKIIKLILLLLVFMNAPNAQNLVPYQIQIIDSGNKQSLWGYKTINQNIIIKPINDYPYFFKNGYAILEQNNKFGLIDSLGNIVLKPLYDKCSNVEGDYVSVNEQLQNYFINIKTKKEIHLNTLVKEYELSGMPNIFIVRNIYFDSNTLLGLTDDKGNSLLKPLYTHIYAWQSTSATVETEDKKVGVISNNGNWIIEPKYDEILYSNKGISPVKLHSKWGFINSKGKEIISPIFDKVDMLNNGFAKVEISNQHYFIDSLGNSIFKEMKLIDCNNVVNNIFIVTKMDNLQYATNKNGIVINNKGANKIVSVDGANILMLIDSMAYFQIQKKVTQLPYKNINEIYTSQSGLYILKAKNNKNEDCYTLLDKKFNPLIIEDSKYSYWDDYAYCHGEEIAKRLISSQIKVGKFISFVSNKGIDFSEIKK